MNIRQASENKFRITCGKLWRNVDRIWRNFKMNIRKILKYFGKTIKMLATLSTNFGIIARKYYRIFKIIFFKIMFTLCAN